MNSKGFQNSRSQVFTNSVLASRPAATAKKQLKTTQQSQTKARRGDKTNHTHKLGAAVVLFQRLKAHHIVCPWPNLSQRARQKTQHASGSNVNKKQGTSTWTRAEQTDITGRHV